MTEQNTILIQMIDRFLESVSKEVERVDVSTQENTKNLTDLRIKVADMKGRIVAYASVATLVITVVLNTAAKYWIK